MVFVSSTASDKRTMRLGGEKEEIIPRWTVFSFEVNHFGTLFAKLIIEVTMRLKEFLYSSLIRVKITM